MAAICYMATLVTFPAVSDLNNSGPSAPSVLYALSASRLEKENVSYIQELVPAKFSELGLLHLDLEPVLKANIEH